MSDNWIALIPQDMSIHADAAKLKQAIDLFTQIAPDLEEIEIINQEKIKLFDCGCNLEKIKCPHCNQDIDIDWWRDVAEEANHFDIDDLEAGSWFDLSVIALPCCKKQSDLSQLEYSWDMGFSKWGIDAMNPEIGQLSDDHLKQFEDIFGCKLKVIYQHV